MGLVNEVREGYPGYPWDIPIFSMKTVALSPMDINFVFYFFLHIVSLKTAGLSGISIGGMDIHSLGGVKSHIICLMEHVLESL